MDANSQSPIPKKQFPKKKSNFKWVIIIVVAIFTIGVLVATYHLLVTSSLIKKNDTTYTTTEDCTFKDDNSEQEISVSSEVYKDDALSLHLSLAARIDGTVHYISQEEWLEIPDSVKANVEKIGIIIDEPEIAEPFIWNLYMDEGEYSWAKAVEKFGNALPSIEQARAITNSLYGSPNPVGEAIKFFGGDEMPYCRYWTGERNGSPPRNNYIDLEKGYIGNTYSTKSVRIVQPLSTIEEDPKNKHIFMGDKYFQDCDLAVKINGCIGYISLDEWKALSYMEKCRYERIGIVIDQPQYAEPYILSLYPEDIKLTWEDACKRLGDKLPSEMQAKAYQASSDNLSKDTPPDDVHDVSDAIMKFWGAHLHNDYWTRDKNRPDAACTLKSNCTGSCSIRSEYVLPSWLIVSNAMIDDKNQPFFDKNKLYNNFDLAVRLDDEIWFLSVDEWNKLYDFEKNKLERLGIVIDQPQYAEPFILSIYMDRDTLSWSEAYVKFSNRLPSNNQVKALLSSDNGITVDEVIKEFGGDKDPYNNYWSRDEDDSSAIWHFSEINNPVKKIAPAVRTVVSVNAVLSNPKISNIFKGDPTFKSADLVVRIDGEIRYISEEEWMGLSEPEKTQFEKIGVVIDQPKYAEPFIWNLYEERKRYWWAESCDKFGDKLPSKEQGDAIIYCVHQGWDPFDAIITYGGDPHPSNMYWTHDARDEVYSDKWVINRDSPSMIWMRNDVFLSVRTIVPWPKN